MDTNWVTDLVNSAWLFPTLFALVVTDAFLVVVPSETAVVALAALSGATGSPALWALIPVAAAGAIVGDSCCYFIGRKVGLHRWSWQRRGRLGRALDAAAGAVLTRPAVLIFTARYIPFARIAVNLSAGAVGVPYRKLLPLSAAAGLGWAIYNSVVGMFFGYVLEDSPLLAIVVSVVVAVCLGFLADFIATRVSARISQRRAAAAAAAAAAAR